MDKALKSSSVIFFILLTLFGNPALSSGLVISDSTRQYNLSPTVEYLETKNKEIVFQDILNKDAGFIKSGHDILNFGFSDSTYWIKVNLVFDSKNKANKWILELRYPLLDHVEFYSKDKDGRISGIKTGIMTPQSSREINSRNFLFLIDAKPSDTMDIFIKVKSSSSINFDLQLISENQYIVNTQVETFLYGLFYGVLMIMFFYNMFLYFSIRDNAYIYYIIYVLCFILARFSLDGFGAQYLLTDNIWWRKHSIPFFTLSATLAASMFVINFIDIRKSPALLNIIFKIFIALVGISLLSSLFINYSTSIKLSGFLMLMLSPIAIIIGYLCLKKGDRSARFYLVAWITFLLGCILFSLKSFGVIPVNFFTENGQHIGSLAEVVLLSFALGDRINIIKQEREDAQRLAIENLHQADRLKDEFLANTSHELRTPLNGIIGIAESLIDGVAGPMPPKAMQNLKLVSSSGRRLANLINDILDYSKLKNMELELSPRPLDMKSIIDTVLELSRSLAGDKDVRLVNDTEADSVFAYADENRMEQILLNLVGNAIKFTHEGMVRVTADTKGSFVEVAVEDTGIGIPSSAQDRIFESFEQVDGSISRQYGGTGIGLSITKKLVELHSGTISVSSEVGKGSVFRFTVPSSQKELFAAEELIEKVIRKMHDDSADIIDVPAGDQDVGRNRFFDHLAGNKYYDRAVVHIVDDDPVNLQVLENHLSMHHYDIVKSLDGPDAISKIESGKVPDLMLLDIMMPKISGYDVAKILRKRFSMYDLPIMMLTAKNRIEDMVVGFTSGANDYLTKPFDKNELLARVKTLVTLKTAVKENRRLFSIDKEFEIARKILQTAIPEGVPVMSNIDIAVKYIPMESVGGDFYDFHIIDNNRLGAFISDVSGHGVVAALIASMVKIVFRIVEQLASDPVGLLSDMNRMLMGNMGTHFLTASYFYVDIRNRVLRYARAGHEPLIVLNRSTGEFRKYQPRGRAIGFMATSNTELLEIGITTEDRVILYTDGIIEAMNPDGEMFGSKRLMETLIEQKSLTALELTDYILGQMFRWTGRSKSLDDDFSLVVIDLK